VDNFCYLVRYSPRFTVIINSKIFNDSFIKFTKKFQHLKIHDILAFYKLAIPLIPSSKVYF